MLISRTISFNLLLILISKNTSTWFQTGHLKKNIDKQFTLEYLSIKLWHSSELIIISIQLPSTKPELRFCAGSSPAGGLSKIWDGGNLRQWSQLEIRFNVFRRSTILHKQILIIEIYQKIGKSYKKNPSL